MVGDASDDILGGAVVGVDVGLGPAGVDEARLQRVEDDAGAVEG